MWLVSVNCHKCHCEGAQTDYHVEAVVYFQPRVAQLYHLTQLRLRIVDGLVNHYFPNCIFSAQSLNLGVRSVASNHLDLNNLVFGLCILIPLGHFDGQKSAQLILQESRTIVELRPGDIFMFPSACIHHRNAPLADPKNETRKCMVMYSAGALFRWIRQGHTTVANMTEQQLSKEDKDAEGKARCLAGWRLFSHIDELVHRSL